MFTTDHGGSDNEVVNVSSAIRLPSPGVKARKKTAAPISENVRHRGFPGIFFAPPELYAARLYRYREPASPIVLVPERPTSGANKIFFLARKFVCVPVATARRRRFGSEQRSAIDQRSILSRPHSAVCSPPFAQSAQPNFSRSKSVGAFLPNPLRFQPRSRFQGRHIGRRACAPERRYMGRAQWVFDRGFC